MYSSTAPTRNPRQGMLNAALHYASLGYRVFPCLVGGKEPATKHGFKDATLDEDQIAKWWAREPRYNVAISTDGLLVVDADPGSGEWVSDHLDQLVDGPIAMTPRRGRHYWFQQNGTALGNTAGTLATGVDTRGNGGYVLVPPSIVGDRAYQWASEIGTELPTAPQWLIDELAEVTQPPLRDSNVEQIAEGTRNQVIFRFGSFFRRGGLSEGEILASLREINANRCQPPLADGELQTIAKQAARYEPDLIEQARINSHFADAGTAKKGCEKPVARCVTGAAVFEQYLDYVPPQPITTTNGINPQLSSIPLVPGEMTLIGGAPGSGKTGLVYQLLFDALRYNPELNALSVNVEMSYFDLLDRQMSRLANVPLARIRAGTIDKRGAELAPAVEILRRVGPRIHYAEPPYVMPSIRATVDEVKPAILVVDYIQRIGVPGHQDKRNEMNAALDELRRVADQGVAVLILSSLTRTKGKTGNGYDNSTSLGSFRETGELEYAVDTAFIMSAVREKDEPFTKCELKNLKRRHGQRQDIELRADFSIQEFADAPLGSSMPLDEFAIGGGWQ